jgi:hypothetical protein
MAVEILKAAQMEKYEVALGEGFVREVYFKSGHRVG